MCEKISSLQRQNNYSMTTHSTIIKTPSLKAEKMAQKQIKVKGNVIDEEIRVENLSNNIRQVLQIIF